MLADIEEKALEPAVGPVTAEGVEAHGVQCDVELAGVRRAPGGPFVRVARRSPHCFQQCRRGRRGPDRRDDPRRVALDLDVDLWGPIHGVEAFLPRLLEQNEGGHILFTASFAGLVPNVGLGPYCVAKYGVVALAEVLRREMRPHGIGVSVLCPMRVQTNIGNSQRNRQADYGGPRAAAQVEDQSEDNRDMAGQVMTVDRVAALTVAAIEAERLYILPHPESRVSIQRRFARTWTGSSTSSRVCREVPMALMRAGHGVRARLSRKGAGDERSDDHGRPS